jgi:hypothetical protein
MSGTLPTHNEQSGRETALALAKAGFPVFPLRPRSKTPATGRGFKDASRNPAVIATWWRHNPRYGVAVATGHGLAVLDVDTIDGHGTDGPASLARLEQEHGELPRTVEAITPSGGRHVWFLAPPNTKTRPGFADGLDLKARGGYVVVPPTSLDGRGRYAWDAGAHPTETPLAPIPEWLVELDVSPNGDRPAVRTEPAGEAYRRVTEALRARRSARKGDKWQCPAHNDPHPSLSVHEAIDGKVLLKCFAGCTAEDVVAALGLKMADLFDDVPRPSRQEARPAEVEPEPVSLDECVHTYQRWLHLPDADQVRAMIGAVAGNLLDGDALWVLFVGSSGSGKTETIDPLDTVPYVHRVAVITEPALLSGSSKRDTEPGATGGVLRQVGDFGILLAKDFGSVLSMHRDTRAQVMAALREIADGSWIRPLGTTGGRSLVWSGKCGLVGAVTPTIDRHYGVMGALGERFLLYRLHVADPRAQARQRLRNRGREREMREELGAAVAGVLSGVEGGPPAELGEGEAERLVDLATFAVWARTPVERDGYSREVVSMPSREAPARLAGSLGSLLGGLEVIGAGRETRWRIVEKVAWDCLPDLRRRLLLALREASPAKAAHLIARTGIPKPTADRTLEDLSLLGLVERDKEGGHNTAAWVYALADEASEAWPGASYEMSGRVTGTVEEA